MTAKGDLVAEDCASGRFADLFTVNSLWEGSGKREGQEFMGIEIEKQLQECWNRTEVLEARERHFIKELRRLVDESRYGVPPIREQVFVSYSHRDEYWWGLLKTMLAPLIREGAIDIWVDTLIQPGRRWKEEIEAALKRAKVAVLMICADYLASQFIVDIEVRSLLQAEKQSGARVIWFPLKPSLVNRTEIVEFQAAIDPRRPLNGMTEAEQGEALVCIAEAIVAAYNASVVSPGL
jgi:TIR domain